MTNPLDPQQPQQPGWGGQPAMDKKQAKAQAAAQKAYEKSNRNWFARHKVLSALGGLILLGIIISAVSGGGSGDGTTNASDDAATNNTSDNAGTTPSKAAPAAQAPKVKYAGQLKDDKLAGGTGKPGAAVSLSGWTVTASALKPTKSALGTNLCTAVVMTNRDDKQQEYNGLSWKLQTPGGDVQDITFTGDNDLSNGGLAPGGKVAKNVCFDDKGGGAGQYVLSWTPDIFSSKKRGIWLNTLAG